MFFKVGLFETDTTISAEVPLSRSFVDGVLVFIYFSRDPQLYNIRQQNMGNASSNVAIPSKVDPHALVNVLFWLCFLQVVTDSC